MNRLDELIDVAKARVAQRLALKDSKPYFNLVEPTGAGGREVECDVGMRGEPVVIFLVRVEVVENNVYLAIGRLIGDDFIHECLKVGALLGLRRLASDDAGGDLQSSKEIDCPVTFVGALHPLHDLAAAGLNVAARSLQGLDRRFFIHTEHQSVLWRVQVQPDDIGRLGCKLGVSADAPGTMALP